MRIKNAAVLDALARGELLNLEFGGGRTKRPGFFNVDCVDLDEVDIVANLNVPFESLPDNCVASIYSNHVFEHVQNFVSLMEEIYRIAAPSAVIETVVPHFSNAYFYSDPTHNRAFGLYSMCYFVERAQQPFVRKVPCYYSNARFLLDCINIEFFPGRGLSRRAKPWLEAFFNKTPLRQDLYERQASKFLRAQQLRYVMRPAKSLGDIPTQADTVRTVTY